MKKQYIVLLLSCFLLIPSIYSGQTTPLMQAVQDNDLRYGKELVQQNTDINATDKNGNTALTRAVIKKNKDFIKLLLDHGANLFAANNNGISPWIMALEGNDEEFKQFLRTYKPCPKKDALLLGAAAHVCMSNAESQ